MYAKIKAIVFIACFVGLIINLTGCQSTPSNGIEFLVESRIINERDRIRAEFAKELARWINEDIGRIINTVNAIGDGQAALRLALEEYRRFVLELIERLQQVENQGTATDEMAHGFYDLRDIMPIFKYYMYHLSS